MVEQVTTFAEMLALVDLDAYTPLPEPHSAVFKKLRELRNMGLAGENHNLLVELAPLGQPELVRVFAASSLKADRISPDQIVSLKEYLLRDDSLPIRIAIAKKLQKVPLGEALPPLMEALVESHDPQFQAIVAYAIRDIHAPITWKEKVTQLLKVLQSTDLHREHLDLSAMITAVHPPDDSLKITGNRYLLADYLIEKALTYRDQEPMIGIAAGLLLESVGRNINRANKVVKAYQTSQRLPATRFKHLLVEVNATLTSDEWATRLQESFQDPLQQTTKQIHSMWQDSIRSVQQNISWRQSLSAALFVVGLVVTVVALGYFILIDLSPALVLALIGLVLIVIAVFYSGPVRNVKKTLADIGVANAVYAAYVQRTLEISNGFTRLYLQGELTTKEIEKSNKLISDAMNEAVKALRTEHSGTLEDLLNQLG